MPARPSIHLQVARSCRLLLGHDAQQYLGLTATTRLAFFRSAAPHPPRLYVAVRPSTDPDAYPLASAREPRVRRRRYRLECAPLIQRLAATYWPDQPPQGRHLFLGEPTCVLSSVKDRLELYPLGTSDDDERLTAAPEDAERLPCLLGRRLLHDAPQIQISRGRG
jgi:hypothetical protein